MCSNILLSDCFARYPLCVNIPFGFIHLIRTIIIISEKSINSLTYVKKILANKKSTEVINIAFAGFLTFNIRVFALTKRDKYFIYYYIAF